MTSVAAEQRQLERPSVRADLEQQVPGLLSELLELLELTS